MTADVHRIRLSGMMFGQYLILGSWAVTLATFLMSSPLRGGLGFPPGYTGWIYSTLALAGIVAPIFIGLLADHLFDSTKLMAFLHFIGSLLLGALAWYCLHQQPLIAAAYRSAVAEERIDGIPLLEMEKRLAESPSEATPEIKQAIRDAFGRVQQDPELVHLVNETFLILFVLMAIYAFCVITSNTLCSVIAFRNLHDPQRSFGNIRLFGTVGWIVAGVQLELFWNTLSPAPLFFSAGISLVFSLYCLTLPSTPPSGLAKTLGQALGLPALSMFRRGSFCVLIFCALGISAVQQFYSIYTNRFLMELRTPFPAAVQTLAQVMEVICMMLIPFAVQRFGLKWTMVVGIFGWILRNAVFAS
ncbi:MAG: MFS transporter, partial [Planctomycetes bacterium]|nr:MFS transporter [Planctomycetota bacterium]